MRSRSPTAHSSMCECTCVCEKEKERERECVCYDYAARPNMHAFIQRATLQPARLIAFKNKLTQIHVRIHTFEHIYMCVSLQRAQSIKISHTRTHTFTQKPRVEKPNMHAHTRMHTIISSYMNTSTVHTRAQTPTNTQKNSHYSPRILARLSHSLSSARIKTYTHITQSNGWGKSHAFVL